MEDYLGTKGFDFLARTAIISGVLALIVSIIYGKTALESFFVLFPLVGMVYFSILAALEAKRRRKG